MSNNITVIPNLNKTISVEEINSTTSKLNKQNNTSKLNKQNNTLASDASQPFGVDTSNSTISYPGVSSTVTSLQWAFIGDDTIKDKWVPVIDYNSIFLDNKNANRLLEALSNKIDPEFIAENKEEVGILMDGVKDTMENRLFDDKTKTIIIFNSF